MAESYIYAVTRIHSRELSLLNKAFMGQLAAAENEQAAIEMLKGKGWGSDQASSAEKILQEEENKTWQLVKELVKEQGVFDVFLYENDFHNLKAAVKETLTQEHHPGIYSEQGTIPYAFMQQALTERDFSKFPDWMRGTAKEALDLLLTTRDGQLCDCIIDRAALERIREAGEKSGSPLMELYGELRCVTGNINIALRAMRMGKDKTFLHRALAECRTLNREILSEAAAHGEESLFAYLQRTPYAGAVSSIRESTAAFERYCDDLMIEKIRPQRHVPSGIDPIAAYILARKNEIKNVRMILTGKRNEMPEEDIVSRVRTTYV